MIPTFSVLLLVLSTVHCSVLPVPGVTQAFNESQA